MEPPSGQMSDAKRPLRLIRLAEVKYRTGLSTPTIYRRIRAGTFPKSYRIGASIVAWSEAEVDAWIKSALTRQ
jgi:prophage regulatory protein